jgi:hypothetical protein
MTTLWPNQSAQPMPGERLGSNRAPAARHGWPHRWASMASPAVISSPGGSDTQAIMGWRIVVPVTVFLLTSNVIFGMRRLLVGGSRPPIFVPLRFLLVAGLLYLIWRGHQWARVCLGVLLLLSFVTTCSGLFNLHPIFAFDSVLRALCGALLLFAPQARRFVAEQQMKHA